MEIARREATLRICTIILLVMSACLVGFDSQTKIIFASLSRKASFRDMDALCVFVFIDTAAAAYNLLQLARCYFSFRLLQSDAAGSYKTLAWVSFLLDQGAAYVVFGATSAAFQASLLAVTGESSLQWMKVCNVYHRFCVQIGGALLSGYVDCLLMVVLSSISAFHLFRLYSPKRFPLLKRSTTTK